MFEQQAAALDRIKDEADENQQLASLTRDEADAVRRVLDRSSNEASRLGSREQRRYFMYGLLVAVPLGVAGNFAFELVKAWLAG